MMGECRQCGRRVSSVDLDAGVCGFCAEYGRDCVAVSRDLKSMRIRDGLRGKFIAVRLENLTTNDLMALQSMAGQLMQERGWVECEAKSR